MFAKAAIANSKPAPKGKAKGDITKLIEGVEGHAAIDLVIKALEGLKKTYEADVKQAGTDHFVAEGMLIKRRPENFKGTEGDAETSVQLRAKSSATAISPEDHARLIEHSIPVTVSDNVVETFIINPEYANNAELLAKVEKALGRVAGLPEDFIQKQIDQKVVCDGENSINAVMALSDEATVRALLPLVSTLALKPSYKGEISDAFDFVSDLLVGETGEPA